MSDPTTASLSEGLARGLQTDYLLMADDLTEQEAELFAKVHRFGQKELLPIVNDYWERGEFPHEVVPKFAELGIVGDTMEGYDTTPMSAVGQGLIAYELSRIDGSLATFFGVHVNLAMQSIYLLGSQEQKQQWLPPMARMEKVGAFALTEPDHGSDAVSLQTTARREGDTWILSGRKRWPGNATWCDVVVVYARDEADGQVKGFIVPRETPGYSATRIGGKVALRMVENADIVLDDVRVPESQRLQRCDSFVDVSKVLSGTRNMVAWSATGHAAAAYEIALQYAQRRVQFGRPIAKTQLVQSMLVQMLSELTSMQLYCIRMGRLIDEGKLTETMASLAKYHCTVKAREVCRLARDILGGNGITLEFHIIRHLCDMEALVTFEGTAEIQALIVGRQITGQSAFV